MTLLNLVREKLPCCDFLQNCGQRNEGDEIECEQQVGNFNNDLPDRMLHPEQYMHMTAYAYDSIS